MNRRSFVIGTAAAGSAALLGVPVRADDVGDTLTAITKARAGLKTLVAPFAQDRQIGLLATAVKSDGELTLVLPDRLRWELKPPDAITYWITPQGFAFATASGSASAGKSAAGKFGDVLGDLMTLLSGDLNKLRARYDFSVPSKAGDIVLVAIPKDPKIVKQVKRLELTAGADLWTVKKIVIEEQNGDKSVIVFGRLQRDVKVDPARMQPPK